LKPAKNAQPGRTEKAGFMMGLFMRIPVLALMTLLGGIAAGNAGGAGDWRLMHTPPYGSLDPPRETANLLPPVVNTGTGQVAGMTGSAAFYVRIVGGPVFNDGSAGDIQRVIPLAAWRGKPVRLTLRFKTEGTISAGIQTAIAVAGGKRSGSRMVNTLRGKGDWQSCQFVRDVPAGAGAYVIDLHLHGKGTLWIDAVGLQAVGDNATPTGNCIAGDTA
jgi:hypothetical protein